MAMFRKLPTGEWGVLVPLTELAMAPDAPANNGEDDGLGQAHKPIPGSRVSVTKRDGSTQVITLGAQVDRNGYGTIFKIAPRETRPAPQNASIGDLSGIFALFERARRHLRFPAIILLVPDVDTIRISMAGERARVPGSLNIASQERFVDGRRVWYGRVLPNGSFEQRAEFSTGPALVSQLLELAHHPAEVAAAHGRLTGRCCFCSRSLDDVRSTAVGYGPVCAEHYGLPWGERPVTFAAPVSERDPKTLYPARLADGWWVMDQFGPLDGPYATVGDANGAIAAENEFRHISFVRGGLSRGETSPD